MAQSGIIGPQDDGPTIPTAWIYSAEHIKEFFKGKGWRCTDNEAQMVQRFVQSKVNTVELMVVKTVKPNEHGECTCGWDIWNNANTTKFRHCPGCGAKIIG